MKILDDLQENIENILSGDHLMYLAIAGVMLLILGICYGFYLIIINILLPLF